MAPYSPVHNVQVTIIPKDETQSTTPASREFFVDAANDAAIGVGSVVWMKPDGSLALVTTGVDHSLLGIVTNVWIATGGVRERPRDGFIPALTAGIVEVVPFTNIAAIEMTEDAIGGPLDFPTVSHVVAITQDIIGASANTTLLNFSTKVLIDSSAATAAPTNALFSIAGVADPYGDQRPSGDTTSARRYRLVPVAGKVQSAV